MSNKIFFKGINSSLNSSTINTTNFTNVLTEAAKVTGTVLTTKNLIGKDDSSTNSLDPQIADSVTSKLIVGAAIGAVGYTANKIINKITESNNNRSIDTTSTKINQISFKDDINDKSCMDNLSTYNTKEASIRLDKNNQGWVSNIAYLNTLQTATRLLTIDILNNNGVISSNFNKLDSRLDNIQTIIKNLESSNIKFHKRISQYENLQKEIKRINDQYKLDKESLHKRINRYQDDLSKIIDIRIKENLTSKEISGNSYSNNPIGNNIRNNDIDKIHDEKDHKTESNNWNIRELIANTTFGIIVGTFIKNIGVKNWRITKDIGNLLDWIKPFLSKLLNKIKNILDKTVVGIITQLLGWVWILIYGLFKIYVWITDSKEEWWTFITKYIKHIIIIIILLFSFYHILYK